MYTSLHTHIYIYIYWSNYLYHLPVAFFCCFGQNAGFEVKRRKNKPSNIFPIFRAWRKPTITLLRVIPTMAFQSITYAISYDILLSGICIWHIFWHSFWHSIWYIFGNSLWLRNTLLWSGAHGWGPAGNTLIWSLRWRACSWGPAEEGGGGGGPADIKSNNPHLDLAGGEKWNGTSRR